MKLKMSRIPSCLGSLRKTLFAPTLLLCFLTLGSCSNRLGDPASSAMAVLSKHPASFTERLLALDALIRQSEGMPAFPSLAESLMVHRKSLSNQLSKDTEMDKALNEMRAFVNDTLKIAPQPDSPSLELSLPSEALIRRRGSCVSLSLLYLAYSEGLTLTLHPILLPGHMALVANEGQLRNYLETLKPSKDRDSTFYDSTFSLSNRPWYRHQVAQEADAALWALTFNWANRLRDQGHKAWAEELYRFLLQKLPDFPAAAGNLGLLLQSQGDSTSGKNWIDIARAGDPLQP